MGTSKYFNPGTNLDVTNATTSDETDINDVVDELILAFNKVEDDYLTLGPVVIAGTTVSAGALTSPVNVSLVGSDYEIDLLNDGLTHVTSISTDGTLAGNSDTDIPTEKAVKTYTDTKFLAIANIDNVPVSAVTDEPISSGWAYDHVNDSNAHDNLVQPPSSVETTGNIAGMILSNDTDTDHDINISPGACMDSTNSYHILGSTDIAKRIDASWASGDNSGGLLNGTVAASTLYHVYALRNDSNGVADYGFLADGDSIDTYKPASYTYYRWIGFVLTNSSSNIIGFSHFPNDVIIFNAAFEILTNVTTGTLTSQDISGFIPAGRVEYITVGANDNAPSGGVWMGPSSTEAEIGLLADSAATWFEIVTANVTGVAIGNVHPTSAGAIYVDTDTVSTDIWIKAVKIVR